MIDLKELEERVILAAVSTSETDMAERSLDELKELADTAGAKTVGRVIQNRESVHPGTYLGKGKLQELREMLYETGATGVICDDELSPAQLKNLEDILDTKVMDRTMVILDIFAARANTRGRQDPGRTGPVKIPCHPSGGNAFLSFQTGRRYRYKRTW